MMRRLLGALVSIALFAACSTTIQEGGSRTDFIECDSSADCEEGACIEGACDPDVPVVTTDMDLAGQPCTGAEGCASLLCDSQRSVCVPDCRDPDRNCRAPLVCAGSGGEYACTTPTPEPICTAVPTGQAVPFTAANEDGTGAPLHWANLEHCVAVTYASALLPESQGLVAEAVAAWSNIPCSNLCLSGPQANDRRPDVLRGERRIHFVSGTSSVFDENAITGLPEVNYEQPTGRILSVVVTMNIELEDQLSVDEYLEMLGHALGLGHARDVESVMALDTTVADLPLDRFLAPTELDTAALCQMYGDDPYCE